MKLTEPAVRQPEVENDPKERSGVVDRPFDPIAFDLAMKKWRGFLRVQLLADGYTTAEALMNDIRDR